MPSIKELHMGNLIDAQIIKVGMTKAEFGRRINTSRQNVNTLLKKPFLSIDLLLKICSVLNYNFLDELVEYLPKELQESGEGTVIQKVYSVTISLNSEDQFREIIRVLQPSEGTSEDKSSFPISAA